MLRPSETLHRLLLSSPARFVAEYEADGFALAHAWDLERFRDERSPLMRTFLMLSFTTGDLVKAPGVSVPDYSLVQRDQPGEDQAAKQLAQHLDREEERGA